MSSFIEEKVREWGSNEARETNLRLQHLEKRLYSSYEVCLPPNPDFWSRLKGWISNANGDIALEKQLFQSINYIFYVGREEFNELYKQAYNGPIARWLIDKENISFTDTNAKNKLLAAVDKTWFCPITDSMIINRFYHLNNIHSSGADLRPDWRTLHKFADEALIRSYIKNYGIKYIVLLEDFIGGGSQIQDAVTFVNKFSDIVSILIIPLIICPKGIDTCNNFSKTTNVKFEPVLPLSKKSFVSEHKTQGEPPYITELRELADTTYLKVSNGTPPNSVDTNGYQIKPYNSLGWDKTGGLVVMFTNTPDNSLPMLHWTSPKWIPIFPRHSRN